jgi:hypothetical protein
VTGQWFSLGPPVSSTNKTDCHDKTETPSKQTNKNIIWYKLTFLLIFLNSSVFTQTSFVSNNNSLGLVSEQNFKVTLINEK